MIPHRFLLGGERRDRREVVGLERVAHAEQHSEQRGDEWGDHDDRLEAERSGAKGVGRRP
jgi:hypothetical protein